MTSGRDDSDQALDLVLTAGEAEELDRIRTDLRLDAGLAAITRGDSHKRQPRTDAGDSGEPLILSEAANTSAAPEQSLDQAQPQYCVLLAVDIAGSAARSADTQLHMLRSLYALLRQAFEDCGLGWDNYPHQYRGDGILVIAPAETGPTAVVNLLVDRLHVGLRRHNEASTEAGKIRLRVAVHSGLVHHGEYGLVGEALVHIFRLLDAPVLREALGRSKDDLALMVSDHFYETMIRHGADVIHPEAFEPATVAVKETRTRGWLHLPQSSRRVRRSYADARSRDDQIRSPGAEQHSIETPGAPEVLSFCWVPAGR